MNFEACNNVIKRKPTMSTDAPVDDDAVHVFLHTNRPIRKPPNDIHVSTGWWAHTHDMRPYEKGTRNSKFSRDEFPYHSKFASHQAFKYQWLSKLSSAATIREPWLLMDTDTVVQCSAVELRARFAALGSPLIVGGEFQWWPKRDRQHDPWKVQQTGIRYPNSGMLMGTRQGFANLEATFLSMPRYPCCAKFVGGRPTGHCHIDDQHCLQAALLLNSSLPWVIDSSASLFLNLLGVSKDEIESRDGRCYYKPTGRAPCVLHSNGKMAKPKMSQIFECMPANAWVVPAGSNMTASALFPTTH